MDAAESKGKILSANGRESKACHVCRGQVSAIVVFSKAISVALASTLSAESNVTP